MQILLDMCEKQQYLLWKTGRKTPIYKMYFLSKPDFDGTISLFHPNFPKHFIAAGALKH